MTNTPPEAPKPKPEKPAPQRFVEKTALTFMRWSPVGGRGQTSLPPNSHLYKFPTPPRDISAPVTFFAIAYENLIPACLRF